MYQLLNILALAILLSLPGKSQKISGQWRGNFNEMSNDDATEYVLEIDIKGDKLEGTSITYFTLSGKRYFTMCAITGTYDPASKTIVAKETSKIKANTPDWFRDCFQTHTLTYYKNGNEEQLSGTWKSARREDNCGRGTTLLSRKLMIRPAETEPVPKPPSQPHPENEKEKNITKTDAEKSTRSTTAEKGEKVSTAELPKKINSVSQLEKRTNKVFDTIFVENAEIEISLFDNAEVDGDIITVIFNGDIILSKQTLSEKPIRLTLRPEKGKENLLIMYAENQGKVPPNTAIMRAQSVNAYYKIFLSADEKENAGVVIRFKED